MEKTLSYSSPRKIYKAPVAQIEYLEPEAGMLTISGTTMNFYAGYDEEQDMIIDTETYNW